MAIQHARAPRCVSMILGTCNRQGRKSIIGALEQGAFVSSAAMHARVISNLMVWLSTKMIEAITKPRQRIVIVKDSRWIQRHPGFVADIVAKSVI